MLIYNIYSLETLSYLTVAYVIDRFSVRKELMNTVCMITTTIY